MPSNQQQSNEKETGRIEAFSEGVFAIAITLLVLDLKVPSAHDIPTRLGLIGALLDEWPRYLAYVISFVTILIMWINHHKLFLLIQRADHSLLLLNGLLLMFVTIVPFSTSLLAAFIQHPGAQTAAGVYIGVFEMVALSFYFLWRNATRNDRLLSPDHDRLRVRKITLQYTFAPWVYLVAFGASFVNVLASVAICLLLAVYFALPESKKP